MSAGRGKADVVIGAMRPNFGIGFRDKFGRAAGRVMKQNTDRMLYGYIHKL
jgi:hypothetical protein